MVEVTQTFLQCTCSTLLKDQPLIFQVIVPTVTIYGRMDTRFDVVESELKEGFFSV